jgi:ketosteroid isomerase-like protein
MSEEPTAYDTLERTRLAFDAWNRGDVAVALRDFAADAVWDAVPLGQSFHGVASIRSFLEDWRSPYDEYEIEVEEIVDLGSDVVLAVVIQTTRPVGGRTRTRMRETWAFVYVWTNGIVVRAAAYQDITTARAAAERLAEERG